MGIGSAASIGFVRLVGTFSSASTPTSVTITPQGNVTAGDTIIGAVAIASSGGGAGIDVTSVTDSAGNSYAIDVDLSPGSYNERTVIFSALNVAPLTTSGNITITLSGTVPRVAVSVNEFRGISSRDVLQTTATNGNSTSPLSGSVTATQANDLIFGAVGHQASTSTSASFTAGGNYSALTVATANGSGVSAGIGPEYRIVSATGTYSANGTLSATEQWSADIATYKAAPVPAVGSVSPNAGPTSGNTTVTITGVNFTGAKAVYFGGTAATSFTVNSATQITATAPAGSGTVDITVNCYGNTSATSTADQFTYYAPFTFSPATLTAATFGTSYSQTISASNGTSPYTYAVSSGSLPGGLSLSTGGALVGTPTAVGTTSFTVTATDANGHVGSQAFTFTVNKATSTTTITDTTSSSTFGTTVTFTATVTGIGATPTGTVTFTDNSVSLATASLSGGVATYTGSATLLAVGTDTVVAVYSGDTNFNSSTSATLNQTVSKANATTTVSNTSNPSVFGQSVNLTATVSSSTSGTPTGTVTFSDGGTSIGTAALSTGVAILAKSFGSVATHTITATYAGDTNFNASPVSGNFSQTVNQANSTTTVTDTATSMVFGQSVTLTATVTATSPGSGTATGGIVTFLDGSTSIGTSLLTAGTASLVTSFTSVTTHTIKAFYAGDTNFLASPTSAGLNQTVSKASTTTVTSTTPSASVTGQSVTWTVTVSVSSPGAGTPTGTVTFRDNGTSVGTGLLNGTTATFTNTFTSATTQTLSAIYSGDNNFLTSTAATVTQMVNQASTTATLTGSSVDQAVTGQSMTFTATVSVVSPGAGNPTGTVTFQDGGTSIGTGALSSGTTTLATSFGAAVIQTITVVYNGDSNFAAAGTSAVFTQTVNQAGTTTTVSSSSNPSVFGQTVTFTATVSAVSPGLGNPTGTVTFSDGGVSVATSLLSAGKASFTTSYSAVSSHTITASYFGDDNYIASPVSTDFIQTVNQANATIVTSNPSNPSVFGQSVTLTATVSATSPGVGTPTGMVTFEDDGVSIGTGVAGSIPATLVTSFTSVATHTVTVVYTDDPNFSGSTSVPFSQTVTKASTTMVVTLTATTNPLVTGQSVTWTVTVSAGSPGAGSPTGTVTFRDNGVSVGTGLLSDTTATFTNTFTSATTQTLSAIYSGDNNFLTSTAATVTQTVNQASTTATLTGSSVDQAVTGQSMTFTATVSVVSPGAGNPTGTVTFQDGGTSIGTGALSGAGTAILATSFGSAVTQTITVVYNGDTNFAGAGTSAGFTQTVNQASTTTTVSSSSNPSVFGQTVTFTATVSAVSPGLGNPTGTVTFSDGGVSVATGLLGVGMASFTTSYSAVSSYTITASYPGDSNYTGSTTTTDFVQTVNPANVTTTVSNASNPSVFGQSVTLTATVSATSPGVGTPTGMVTFEDDGVSIGTGVAGSIPATLVTSFTSVATHTVTVVYTDDPNFSGSTSVPFSQTVTKASTTMVVTLTATTNPSVTGQSVTWTVTVSAGSPGAGSPTGTVTFRDNGVSVGTGLLSDTTATFTNTFTSATTQTLSAIYSGDNNFLTSTAATVTQMVNQASTTATLTGSSVDQAVTGQSMTFTATVSVVSPGAGNPTGTVTFQDGGTSIGTGALSSGTATLATSFGSAVIQTITVVYNGDNNFAAAGTSAVFTQTVNQAGTTTTVSSSSNPSVFGQTVTFTATVSAVSPGLGNPTGTVTFSDGGVSVATGLLSVGMASFTTSYSAVSSYTITASYPGDSNYTGSTTTTDFVQTVNPANVTTTVSNASNPSVFGQSVTLTATVSATSPGVGTPTGMVTFEDDGVSIGTGVAGSIPATLVTSFTSVATHTVTVVYTDDPNFSGSTSVPFSQTVTKASTTMVVTLTAATNPLVTGQSVTWTVTVSAGSPGAGSPTGTVTFRDNGVSVGTGLLSDTTATFTNTFTSATTQTLSAIYSGDNNFLTSTAATVTQMVNQASTTATLTGSSVDQAVTGQSMTFTATVSVVSPGAGNPTGTVTFQDGGTSIGTGALSGGGTATLATSFGSAVMQMITVVYNGDSNFAGAGTSASFTQTVNEAGTTTTVSSSANPSVFGQTVTFTATVSAVSPAAGTPTGTVTFSDGGVWWRRACSVPARHCSRRVTARQAATPSRPAISVMAITLPVRRRRILFKP